MLLLMYVLSSVCSVHADSLTNGEQSSSTDHLLVKLLPYEVYGTTTVSVGMDKSANANYGFGMQVLFGNESKKY
jgi:hypothetical protein